MSDRKTQRRRPRFERTAGPVARRERLSPDALRMRSAIERRLFGGALAPATPEPAVRDRIELARERHRTGDLAAAWMHARAARRLLTDAGVEDPSLLEEIERLLALLEGG